MFRFSGYLVAIIAPVFAQQQLTPTINQSPSRQFGQPALLPSLNSVAPNLVEGRELWGPTNVAVDNSVSPPILYVADANNNRVLAWKNANAFGVCGINNSGCGFADLVIGQRNNDLTATLPGGPGRGNGSSSSGLFGPTAIAVDASGNLYVVDSGNHRILRYPSPFKQTSAVLTPDLVIGQKTVNTGTSPNEGSTASAKTLNFQNGFVTGIALDSTGALWVPDPGNNRVLRFPASQLTAGTIEPVADIVLGQTDFQTSTERPVPNGAQVPSAAFYKGNLRSPSAVAVAPNGAVYVADAYSRVLYFSPGLTPGSAGVLAARILGTAIPVNNQPTPPTPNNLQFGNLVLGLFMQGSNLWVADAGNNRIVKYDIPDNWPPEQNLTAQIYSSQFSPAMVDVIGQVGFTNNKTNKAQPEPDATTVSTPFGGAFMGTDLWIADYGNNRVFAMPQVSGRYVSGTRLIGQLDWPFNTPNLIEGREVAFASSSSAFAGLAIDNTSNPPHLYVSDTLNNRILGFRDARNIGGKADIVIGQRDFYRSLINGPKNDPQIPNQFGIFAPRGLVVDAAGNLYVADSGNGRVLRYPAPFNAPDPSQLLPNLVLGQVSFSAATFDATNQNMQAPVGLAMFSDGSLAVSDVALNRVMIFKKPAGADFTSGQTASAILGQPNANSGSPSNSSAGLNSPRQIATDTSDRLYVADFGNNRLMVWTDARNQATGATSAAFFNNLPGTQGVVVSPISGEIWISNSQNDQILRLPEFNQLSANSTPNSYPTNGFIQAQTAAAAVILDSLDNPIVAEAANRVTFFYPAMLYKHAASYNDTHGIAPGMLVQIGRSGKDYPMSSATAQSLPWPTTLADTQVFVNGIPAPLYFVGFVINLQVPTQNMPTSGTVEFVVKRASTGEILSTGQFQMAPYSPGIFTANALGTGQIIANNDDGTRNASNNGVSGDGKHYITLCLTGAGVFDGGPNPPPADGADPSPNGPAATHILPVISLVPPGTQATPDMILYSGAGCGFPGGWQINLKIPFGVVPGPNNQIVIQMQDAASNVGPGNTRITTTYTSK